MTGTRKWLRTLFHTDTPGEVRMAVSSVVAAMTTRLATTDRSRISYFRRYHSLGSAEPLWKPVLRSRVKVAGMRVLTRMRVGSFYYAYRLAAAGRIDPMYFSVCPCCGDSVREDLNHILLICNRWSNQRSLILGDLIELYSNLQDERILGVLLGGEFHADRTLRVQVTVATATYLSLIVPIRIRLLESLIL